MTDECKHDQGWIEGGENEDGEYFDICAGCWKSDLMIRDEESRAPRPEVEKEGERG